MLADCLELVAAVGVSGAGLALRADEFGPFRDLDAFNEVGGWSADAAIAHSEFLLPPPGRYTAQENRQHREGSDFGS